MNASFSKIEATLIARADLTASDAAAMFRLLMAHFDGVHEEQFHRDLKEKNWVILLRRQRELVGFTTLLLYRSAYKDEPLNVVYSGDTIVAPQAWGTTSLPRAWIGAINHLREGLPAGRVFWLLLVSGFRTYRFLPVFWKTFAPRFDAKAPEETQAILSVLARERFGARFDEVRGLVRFERPQQLHPRLGHIPKGRAKDPHIAFFAERNPGHLAGDELVCLTELAPENLTEAGRLMAYGQRAQRVATRGGGRGA